MILCGFEQAVVLMALLGCLEKAEAVGKEEDGQVNVTQEDFLVFGTAFVRV